MKLPTVAGVTRYADPPAAVVTCIVGIVAAGEVIIGGDSAGVAGMNITLRKDPKVFQNGPALIGYTSSYRMGQILRYDLTIPMKDHDTDTHEWMCRTVIPSIREALKSGGCMKSEEGADICGVFLIGAYGRLFEVDSDFQVGESFDEFLAVGCGAEFALGALESTRMMDPDQRVAHALTVAAKFSGGVAAPFFVERLNR